MCERVRYCVHFACVCVCGPVGVHACVRVYVCAYVNVVVVYARSRVCVRLCVCVCLHDGVHACVYASACVCERVLLCALVRVGVCALTFLFLCVWVRAFPVCACESVRKIVRACLWACVFVCVRVHMPACVRSACGRYLFALERVCAL
jgi:hypothetical protein